MLHSRISVTAS